MRTYAEKLKSPQRATFAKTTARGRSHLGQSAEARSAVHLPHTLPSGTRGLEAELTGPASPRIANGFSEVPARPAPQMLPRACPCGGGCPKCRAEQQPGRDHESVPTKHVATRDPRQVAAPPIVHEVLRSPGQRIDRATRAFMERRFDHSFSEVSIHTGPKAAESARVLNAAAYTVGSHVVFGKSKSAGGPLHTLAHELAHVVQQRRGSAASPRAGSDYLEHAADAAAFAVIAGKGPVHVQGASAPGLARQPATGAADSDDQIPVARFENEDGTWTTVNSRGEVLYTGPLGLVVDPNLPNMYSTLVVGEREKTDEEKKAALRQWADPAWSDPLSPIGEPESYDPEIYDHEVLARRAAERKFDKYDREEYGAHGVIYKRRGSGRVYANDIASEDYDELIERFGVAVSTDPDRVVLPTGAYAFETVYEGKLLKKIMEENNLPPEAIHLVAALLEAEAESGAYLGVAGIGTARFFGQGKTFTPPSARKAPGFFGRTYLKMRLAVGLAGRGVDRAGGNPAIGAGGGTTVTLRQPAFTATKVTTSTPTVRVNTQKPVDTATKATSGDVTKRASVDKPVVVAKDASMRRPRGGGNRAGMTATGKTLTPHKTPAPVVEVLPRTTVPMADFEPAEPGHYIRRKPPSAETQRKILEQAGRTRDGRLRDANTGRALEEGEAVWGHAPNYQFKDMRDMAEKLRWTQEEFDKFFEDPAKWQVEYGPSNSGRVFDRIPRQRPVH